HKHSLLNLGHSFGVERTVDVIAAFFEVLRSDGLLKAFQAKAEQVQKEYDDSQNVEPPSQSSMTPDRVLALKYRAYVYQLWLEVIGGNDADQLRYYLRNLLVFQVIPGIISQALAAGKYADAMGLAKQIHQSPGVTPDDEAARKDAPSYFALIMVYAAQLRFDGFQGLLPVVKDAGEVDAEFLCHCNEGYKAGSPWHVFGSVLNLHGPENPDTWHQKNEARCYSVKLKYSRSVIFRPRPLVTIGRLLGEDISDLTEPYVGQIQG
ncbi:hypothetical protein H4R35_003527, partial [Dimargaris xerosporica]